MTTQRLQVFGSDTPTKDKKAYQILKSLINACRQENADLIARHTKNLSKHLVQQKITSADVVIPFIENIFQELNLSRQDITNALPQLNQQFSLLETKIIQLRHRQQFAGTHESQEIGRKISPLSCLQLQYLSLTTALQVYKPPHDINHLETHPNLKLNAPSTAVKRILIWTTLLNLGSAGILSLVLGGNAIAAKHFNDEIAKNLLSDQSTALDVQLGKLDLNNTLGTLISLLIIIGFTSLALLAGYQLYQYLKDETPPPQTPTINR